MTGTGRLIRLILRRDRMIMPIWVLLLGVVPAGYVASFQGLFATDQERIAYAQIGSNAGFVALYGLLKGDSFGELAAWRAGFLPVMIGLCVLLTVIRHTRVEEEAGRTDLIGAAVVGRQAPLAAALITAAGASLLIGLVLVGAMTGQGMPLDGSLAFGAEFVLAGWIFAGVAAIAAQLTGSARAARSIAVVVLGASYVLRVGGDISTLGDGSLAWLSWISPLGWVTHIFPYATNAWWPMVPSALFSISAVVIAVVLRGRRDLGAGLLPARLGRATAAATLCTPLALAWRLHRGLLIGWIVGFALLGLVFGAVGGSVVDLAGGNKGMSDIFARLGGAKTLTDNYFASTAGIVGLIAACYAVQATLRLRDEEQTGRAEAVLATAVSRLGWAGSHLLFSLVGSALVLFAEGLVAALAFPEGEFGEVLAASMVQLPAVWVMAAVAVLLFGLLPRYAAVAWAAPFLCLLLLLAGGVLRLDQWVLDISPFTHVPHLPGADPAPTPLITLTVVALALAVAGLTGLRRRNVPD
ncbi:MAG TPA: ABC transporter permease [Actinoplanes sp.]